AGNMLPARSYTGPVRSCHSTGEVGDLHAPVHAGGRIGGVLELLLAVADRDQRLRLDVEVLHQEALDREGAALRKALVVGVASDPVGVAGDQQGAAAEPRVAAGTCPKRGRLSRS